MGWRGGWGIDGRRQAIKQTWKGDHSQAVGNEEVSSQGRSVNEVAYTHAPTALLALSSQACSLLGALWGPTRGSLPQSIGPREDVVSMLQSWHPSLIWWYSKEAVCTSPHCCLPDMLQSSSCSEDNHLQRADGSSNVAVPLRHLHVLLRWLWGHGLLAVTGSWCNRDQRQKPTVGLPATDSFKCICHSDDPYLFCNGVTLKSSSSCRVHYLHGHVIQLGSFGD